MKKYMNESVGQFSIEGNRTPELHWIFAKLALSCFISKRLAEFAVEPRCEKCSSHLNFGHGCITCTDN